MHQALRQLRRPEHGRKKLTVSTLLLLTCALVMPGCASLGLSDQLLSNADSWGNQPSTIRSQNFSDADVTGSASTVTADYSPLRGSNGPTGTNPPASTNDNGVVPVFATGHAFVQRRAKLGRPIPIRDRIETRSAERIESIAPPADNQNFNDTSTVPAGNVPVAAVQVGSVQDGNVQAITNPTPVVRDGISFGTAGWQPAQEANVAPFGASTASSSRQNNLPATNDAWNSDGLQNSGQPQSIGADQLVPSSQSDTLNSPAEEAKAQDMSDDASTGINPEVTEDAAVIDRSSEIPKEQTVLDRLRGLYAPRRDDAALERSRKANRRWTDPFGLMRDREPGAIESPLGATSPVPTSPETSQITADASDVSTAPDNLPSVFEPLILKLEQQLAAWPRQANGKPQNEDEWRQLHMDLRLLYLMAGRSAESMRAIESLSDKEQEFWQNMMLAMETYRGQSDANNRTEQLTETLEYVRLASRHLQPLSQMKLRRMNFCNRIDGFGNFNVFPSADFNAGQPLLLYAEIENYKSELTDDGQYRSEFAAMIEFVRDGETEPIASRTIRLPAIEDRCSTERTDYFQSYEFTIPSLSPGRYTLRLRVRDQLSLQTATSELPFDIRPLGSSR